MNKAPTRISREVPLTVKIAKGEKSALVAVCVKTGYTMSEYVRKLLHATPDYQVEFQAEKLKESA